MPTTTLTDTLLARPWTSITTETDGGGALVTRTIAWDSGLEEVLNYTAGVMPGRTLTDGGDAAGWAEITTSYDGAGTVTSEVTDFDDGQRVSKTYVGGQMTACLREDLGDSAGWTSVAEVFTGGQLTQETITNDDGLMTVRTYSGGVQTGETITDSNDIDVWDEITLVFNGAGEVVDRSVRFDNGTTTTARVTNADPVATDDSATTTEDTPVEIDVSDNDSDADSDTLEITATTDGAHGTVSVDDKGTDDTSDDTLIYTPGSGFSGSDSFTYTVSDGHGGTDTATVNVTVGTPSQITLLSEGFETDGNGTRYTTSTAEFTDGSRDFFLRTDGSNGSDMIHYAGLSSQTGSYYFGGSDLDGEGADATQSLTFSGIDISGVSDLSLSFGNAAWFAEGGFDYDTLFYVTASIDGGPATKIIQFAPEESYDPFMDMYGVSWLAQDTDLNGTPDGTAVNTTFQTFTAAIAGTGSTLDLSFVWYEFDAQGDNHAIDDIVLTGTGFAQEAPELMTNGAAQAAPLDADAFHFVAAEDAGDGLFL